MRPTTLLFSKGFLFLLLISFVIGNAAYGRLVDPSTAQTVAAEFLRARIPQSSPARAKSSAVNVSEMVLVHSELVDVSQLPSSEPCYYVFAVKNDKGFVIVAADDAVVPVLAYSPEGKFDPANLPPAYRAWMTAVKQQLVEVKASPDYPLTRAKGWDSTASQAQRVTANVSGVAPLLSTTWNQGCYYNTYCPAYSEGSCGHVPVGCVAVAMGQIMNYWKYPASNNPIPGYIDGYNYNDDNQPIPNSSFGSIAGVSATSYNWSSMANSLNSSTTPTQNDAVATLLYHCGVSVQMNYGPGGSGAYSYRAANSLVKFFRYPATVAYKERRNFTTSEWKSLLTNELDKGRPMYYSGDSIGSHAFVCDGYQDAEYYHFNWGWGGYANGYFYIDNLNPSNYNFTNHQSVIAGISSSALPVLEYSGYRIDDGSEGVGNGNTIVEPGETIRMPITFKNVGQAPTTAVTVSLSCADPAIDIYVATYKMGSVAVNGLLTFSDFKFRVAQDCAEKPIEFTARFTSAEGSWTKTLMIDVSRLTTRYVSTAGALSSLLTANEKSTLKSISLNGTIDARDFYTLRNEMPALTVVDLRNVSIAAYVGTVGVKESDLQNRELILNKDNTSSWSKVIDSQDAMRVGAATTATYLANQIPNSAFEGMKKLKTVVLPNTLTSIAPYAFFFCEQLNNIKIPVGVSTIGGSAFANCYSLTDLIVDFNSEYYSTQEGVLFTKSGTTLVLFPHGKSQHYTIPSTVSVIGERAFHAHQRLTGVTIPASVTSIGNNAFWNCNGLSTIEIPGSVQTVGAYAFAYCFGISGAIVIPSTLTTLGTNAFVGTADAFVVDVGNPTYASENGVLFSKGKTLLIQCPGGKSGSYEIPDVVTTIGASAFEWCDRLSSVTIPASVSAIQYNAFDGCDGLTSIRSNRATPVDLSGSGEYVFYNVDKNKCTLYVPAGSKSLYQAANQWKDFVNIVEVGGSMKTVHVANPGTLSLLITQAEKTSITEMKLTGTISQPDFIFMRYEMTALADLDLSEVTVAAYTSPSGVRARMASTLVTASGAEIEINHEQNRPQNVASATVYPANEIPQSAFDGMTRLKSIILPVSITSMGDYAFRYCSSLVNITLPAALQSIGFRAFSNCTGMTEILADPANQYFSTQNGVLFDKNATQLIQYPGGKIGNYTIPSTVTRIESYSFYACRKITGITIPTSVTSIGKYAFWNCNGLTNLNLPASVTWVESYAFAYCFFIIDDINLSASLTKIDPYAFIGTGVRIHVDAANPNYSSLDGVLFNKSRTTLITCPGRRPAGDYTILSTVNTIDAGAFEYCRYLTSISIPSAVNSIGYYAFQNCEALTAIHVSGTNGSFSSLDGVLFSKNATTLIQCPGGKQGSYAIPSTVNTLGESAFENCRLLTSVIIPETVSAISHYVFGNCVGLTSIVSKRTTPVDISNSYSVFWNINTSTCTLFVPAGSVELYKAAYQWGSFINIEAINTSGFKTVHLSTAGTLGSLLSASEKETVTRLKLTGVINYPDFLTMRDAMPLLVEVDLSDAAIVEYSGTASVSAAQARPAGMGSDKRVEKDAELNKDRNETMRVAGSTTVVYPANQIPASAFEFKETLTTVHLPVNLTSIGAAAFRHSGLTSLAIPANVVSLGSEALLYCDSLTSFTVASANPAYSAQDGVIFNKNATTLVQFPSGRKGSYAIPSSVTTIGISAFDGCGMLTSVTLPSSVTRIDTYGFWNCYRMTSVNIPTSVTSIGNAAFAYCFALAGTLNIPYSVNSIGESAFVGTYEHFVVDVNNPSYSSFEGVLFSKNGSLLIQCPRRKQGWYTVPSFVTTIGFRAFCYSYLIPGITIPASVSSIGLYPFDDCTSLSEIRVDAGNVYYSSHNGVLLDKNATTLIRCPQGKQGTYSIPETVTALEHDAFSYCEDLTSITLPAAVSTIKSYAFFGCTGLTTFYSERVIPVDLTNSYSVFWGVNVATCALYVPTASVDIYRAANQWSDFQNIIGTNTSDRQLMNDKIQLLPNPVVAEFSIKGFDGTATLTLTDINGRIVMSRHVVQNEKIAVGELAQGLYFAELHTEEGLIVKKMLKK